MYRLPALGDCFLLRLPAGGERPFTVLVDCGVMIGVPTAGAHMRQVAEDIRAVTNGVLDVVSLSKSHFDHLSGFHYAADVFKEMEIRQAWLGWREDPYDAFGRQIAHQLPRYTNFLIPSLRRILAEQSAVGGVAKKLSDEFSSLGEFLRYRPSPTSSKVIERLKSMAHRTHYRSAGEVLDLGGVRVYHLGPPRFTPGEGYLGMVSGLLGGMGLDKEQAMDYTLQLLALFPAPEEISPQERNLLKRSRPFDWTETLPLRDVPKSAYQEFFLKHFGYARGPDHAPQWRRIAPDWLNVAQFVLQQLHHLVAISNQAMAFELVESGKVLLFPGDSQESDWLLWQSLEWKLAEGRMVSLQDLLARTVLYKVSHHGSHLGTPLQPGGLSWLTHPELVALVPVNQEFAEKKHWQMPYAPLLQRLLRVTGGRVLRMDRDMPARPENVSEAEWAQFARRVCFDRDGLWVEYEV
jgi:hypothetical protein